MTMTIPPPPRTPNFRAHGPWGSVVVPTAVITAVISVAGNWLLRPTEPAHAAPAAAAEAAMREDVRELRGDVKQILSRLGALEDAVHNEAAIRDSRTRAP